MGIKLLDFEQIYARNEDYYSLSLLSFILSLTKEWLLLNGNDFMNELSKLNSNKINENILSQLTNSHPLIVKVSNERLMKFLQFQMMQYGSSIIQDLVYLDNIAFIDCTVNIVIREKFILLNHFQKTQIL